jgi:hypothetical protein
MCDQSIESKLAELMAADARAVRKRPRASVLLDASLRCDICSLALRDKGEIIGKQVVCHSDLCVARAKRTERIAEASRVRAADQKRLRDEERAWRKRGGGR